MNIWTLRIKIRLHSLKGYSVMTQFEIFLLL
jgi:hypothetical protein